MGLAHPFHFILSASCQQQLGKSHRCSFCFLNMYSSFSFMPFLFPLKRMLFTQIFPLPVLSQMLTLHFLVTPSKVTSQHTQSSPFIYYITLFSFIHSVFDYVKSVSSLFIVDISSARNLAGLGTTLSGSLG